jgi:hypothetical protein
MMLLPLAYTTFPLADDIFVDSPRVVFGLGGNSDPSLNDMIQYSNSDLATRAKQD